VPGYLKVAPKAPEYERASYTASTSQSQTSTQAGKLLRDVSGYLKATPATGEYEKANVTSSTQPQNSTLVNEGSNDELSKSKRFGGRKLKSAESGEFCIIRRNLSSCVAYARSFQSRPSAERFYGLPFKSKSLKKDNA